LKEQQENDELFELVNALNGTRKDQQINSEEDEEFIMGF